jgi:hypothetical protein
LTIVLLLTLLSCDRIKRKGDNIVDKTKQAASETKQKMSKTKNELIDIVFPTYDNGKADTESNKRRFKEHLQVDLSQDIKNIYAYGDFMGIDYKVLIAFYCDTATINKIVTRKKMILSKQDFDYGLSFGAEFSWWDKKTIEGIKPYKVGKEYEYWEYLWYDQRNKVAYYEAFSL